MQLRKKIQTLIARCGLSVRRQRRALNQPQGIDWIEDSARLLKANRTSVIFDIGANVGQTTEQLINWFPDATIYSFEPSPETFAVLARQFAGYKNVHAMNIALGEEDRQIEFFQNADSETNSLLHSALQAPRWFSADLITPKASTPVMLRTIESFCKEHRLLSIDLMKMDTQGYELHVLRGASKLLASRAIELICAEVLFEDLYEKQSQFHEVYELLFQNGYRLLGLYGSAFSTDNRLLWADALFRRV